MDIDIEHEKFEEDDYFKKMEDIRISSSAYRQVRIGEFISVIFTMCGVLSAIIASETSFALSGEDEQRKIENDLNTLNYINMSATALLGISIIANAQLELRWKQHKHILNFHDTIWNTGIWKGLCFEIIIIFIQPYPFLNKVTYHEGKTGNSDFDS